MLSCRFSSAETNLSAGTLKRPFVAKSYIFDANLSAVFCRATDKLKANIKNVFLNEHKNFMAKSQVEILKNQTKNPFVKDKVKINIFLIFPNKNQYLSFILSKFN